MNEKILKQAFVKIKQDMTQLSIKIDDNEKKTIKAFKTQKSKEVDKIKIDNFIKNVEEELKSLSLQTKEVDDKSTHNSKQFSTFEAKHNEMYDKLLTNKTNIRSNNLGIEDLEDKLGEFSELINEKIILEISGMKLEFTEEIAKVYDACFNEINTIKDGHKKEILELQKELDKKTKEVEKETKKESKKEKKLQAPKPSKAIVIKKNAPEKVNLIEEEVKEKGVMNKMKKFGRWLFVDEYEEEEQKDQIDNIKKDIKSKK